VYLGPPVVVAVLVALGIGADRRAQIVAGTFSVLAVPFFAIPAWGRGTLYLGIGPSSIVKGYRDTLVESRFSVVAVMLLASSVAILIGASRSSSVDRKRVIRRIGLPVFVVWWLIIVAVSFPQTTIRGSDSSWTGRVDRVLSSDCSGRPPSTIVSVPNLVHAGSIFPEKRSGYYPLVVRCSNLE
jgi:hypothetical protein